VRLQPISKPKANQDARGVWRELDPGAGFFEAFGLFEHQRAKAIARQSERRGQPANAGAGDDDGARGG
jgi:hypothetical protein